MQRTTKTFSGQTLSPQSEVGQTFCQWFNHPWSFITAKNPQDKKAQWHTETRYALDPRNLWNAHQDPDQLLGLRFGQTTRYALLDIDIHSPHHPRQNPNAIRDMGYALEDIGIVRSIAVQSSWSEGIHLYLFLPEAVPTIDLAIALKTTLEQAGKPIKSGHLEIFPNVKLYDPDNPSHYNGHRLPLQPKSGSYILDDDFFPLCGGAESVETLCAIAATQSRAQDMELLKKSLKTLKKQHLAQSYGTTNPDITAWRNDLLAVIQEGWTSLGQTNDILGKLAQYSRVFEQIDNPHQLTQRIIERAQSLPGYWQFCQHIHEIEQRAKDWARSAMQKYWPLGSRPGKTAQPKDPEARRKTNINQERHKAARERITIAYDHLKKTGTIPTAIAALCEALNAIAQKLTGIGISRTTLYKPENRALWYPAQPTPQPSVIAEPASDTAESQPNPSPPPKSPDPLNHQDITDQAPNKGEACFFPLLTAATLVERVKLKLKSFRAGKQIAQTLIFSVAPSSRLTTRQRVRLEEVGRLLWLWRTGEVELVAEVRRWLSDPRCDLTAEERAWFFDSDLVPF